MNEILIKNGRIFDGFGFRRGNVLVSNGLVEKIAPDLDCDAKFTFDAAGMTVLPGLVDIHMHLKGFSPAKLAAPVDSSCFPFGVTAAADVSATLGDMATADVFGVKTCVFGLCKTKAGRAQLKEAIENLAKYGDNAVGFKLFYDEREDTQLKDAAALAEVSAYAHSRGMRVTVHTERCPIPMGRLMEALQPGDIVTHVYHGGKNTAAEDDFVCLLDAKKRGVLLDVGFAGSGHVDFAILRNAIAAGAGPDMISTDLVRWMVYTRGGRYGLTMCMSIARYLGMEEEAIFRSVTSASASALGRPWGVLQEGGCADIAVLEYGDEPFGLTDKAGYRIQSDCGYRCQLTVSDGQVVYRG